MPRKPSGVTMTDQAAANCLCTGTDQAAAITVCVPVHSGQESELSLCYRLFCTSFYILTAMSMLSENLRYLYECSELCDSFHVKNSLQYLPIETVGSDQVSNSTCSLGFI